MPVEEHAAEIWRDIPPLPGYQASSLGRIRSLTRRVAMVCQSGKVVYRTHAGRVLRVKTKPNGYRFFHADGRSHWQVNRAVCWAFKGPPPSEEHHAAHRDGNSLRDVPGNLVWATPIENASHKVLHGTAPIGSKNGTSLLGEVAARSIIAAYADGASSEDLARFHGVSVEAVLNVTSGRSWAHVVSPYRAAAALRSKENQRRGLSWNH